MRIGIDVGGTHTDAVLMDGARVLGTRKTPTTAEVAGGISLALRELITVVGVDVGAVDAVMIGTTHFTNAVVEGKHLQPTACIRLGLPATASLPPMVDWPEGLRETIGGHWWLAHGGHELDGREISAPDEAEISGIARQIARKGITGVAISSVFSPANAAHEELAAAVVREVTPEADVTLSSSIGRMGLLERENAAILNASLRSLARRTVAGFEVALAEVGIAAPCYVSQNDGTLMGAGFAARYPVLTFASGATNSMRGAAFLTGCRDAIVIDVGGTTTDVGVLRHGFPRVASRTVSIAGVRTNFRMPDTLSIGLGGGSVIATDPLEIGPGSVGHELTTRALVFGGGTLTATDVVVAAGRADVGDRSRVRHLETGLIAAVEDHVEEAVNRAVERMRSSAAPVPVIVVGGGGILIHRPVAGAGEMLVPEHHAVANAIGAAIAQVGGACDRIFALVDMSRDAALQAARREAADRAVAAGADPASVSFVDVDEVPIAYLPGNATRILVRAVGELKPGG